MRVAVPEYSKLIATTKGEAVMSTPSWWHKHGADSALFVDAHHWPPHIVKHAGRIAAATRQPDGQWVCALKRDGEWRICWFADIRATQPLRSEPVPVSAKPDDGDDDDGPILHLHTFAGRVLATAYDGALWLRDAAGWTKHPTLTGDSLGAMRNFEIDGKPLLEWNGDVYDAQLATVDVRDCADFLNVGARLFAIHDLRLVEYKPDDIPLVLPDHELSSVEAGPGDTVVLSLARDGERGTHYDHALFDPRTHAVTMLPEDKVGQFPEIITFTDAHDIVLHDDNGSGDDDDQHALWLYTAAEIAALAHVPVAEVPVPPKLRLDTYDADARPASRPLLATTGDAIVIALGKTLRFHTVDAPRVVHEHGRMIVAVASRRDQFGALDMNGVLHTYSRDGVLIESRPAIDTPHSLAATADAWIAIGMQRTAMIEDTRTRTLELAGGLAAAVDPGGDILFACADHRLAYWTRGELRDLPPPVEQIVAVAPLGNRRFACVGKRELYQLDLAEGELIRLEHRLRRPFITTHLATGHVAGCTDPGGVEVGVYAANALTAIPKGSVRYSSYSAPADVDVTVQGLAFMDDGRLVIALDEGRGNIFDPETGAALKLDPQPGDAVSRWVFICGGKILIAE